MERVTDWARLWSELVHMRAARYRDEVRGQGDAWRTRARGFDETVRRRWAQPDSSRRMVLSHVGPETTVLDIGAGTGAWAALLARHARQVTAVDPSPAMIEVMGENLAAEGLTNVRVVQGTWPEVAVEPHDLSLCAHAMYMSPDLPAFIRRMVEVTRDTCFLLMRMPLPGSVMSVAAQHVLGQPHDSPNFIIAYNVLIQMGIYPNVLMEDTPPWGGWTHDTLEDALAEMKSKLGLLGGSAHDDLLMALLRERLTSRDGRYVWPPAMRSALVYWDVA